MRKSAERNSEAKDELLDELDLLRAHGYLILEGLAPLAAIDTVAAELEHHFARTPRCEGDFYGWRTTRFGALLAKSRAGHALVLHPRILALMDAILGPHCDRYQLNLGQAVRIHPGERAQVPHRDEEMWPGPKGRMEYMVNVMWALDEFTKANGATRLWPRSQFAPLDRAIREEDAVTVEMPRGSALVFLGSVTHGGGANRSAATRTGLIFSYALGWLRQSENQYLACPPEIARSFPERLRDLIGYRIHRPNLGSHEGQDPSSMFEHPAGEPLAAVDALPEAIATEVAAYYRGHAR